MKLALAYLKDAPDWSAGTDSSNAAPFFEGLRALRVGQRPRSEFLRLFPSCDAPRSSIGRAKSRHMVVRAGRTFSGDGRRVLS